MPDPIYDVHADIWIKYDYDIDKFKYMTELTNNDFITLENGDILNFWQIKSKNTRQNIQYTVDFPEYWDHCLSMTKTFSNYSRIIWGPIPNFTATNYYIYRAAHTQQTAPRNRNYQLSAIVSNNQYSYIDTEVGVDQGNWYFYYYVKAYNSINSTFSPPTNVVETSGSFNPYKPNSENQENISFNLLQNHPNPFNPTTVINYTILRASYVTLKVYNSLGKEVAALVNGNKEAGKHAVTFDGSGLPSGVYFYTLTAGEFTDTKKLILMK